MSPAASQNIHFTDSSPFSGASSMSYPNSIRLGEPSANSPGSSPEQNNLHRLKDNPKVQTEGSVLDVEQVVLQFLARILERVAVFILHLRPTRDSRPHGVADPVIWNLGAQPLHELGTLRTRAHEMHVAPQHAPELRQLI